MSGEHRSAIADLLARIRDGSEEARAALFEHVCAELRRMAHRMLAKERSDHTLQPTALVHEAYLKVFGGAPLQAWDCAYFFAAQARAMRQLLVDHARRRAAAKRPKPRNKVTLDGILDTFGSTQRVTLLDLEDALEEI